jgi:2-oxo-4-hydroxy-4-carboxy-5-ureidoimidazoline decarboxylase
MTEDDLLSCCGSRRWAQAMATAGSEELFDRAERIWWALEPADWREAFRAHPKIGGANTPEQAGMRSADPLTVEAIARLNEEYFEKFGFIFIVCATGKSGEEMLSLLQSRIHNDPEEELRIAAGEQAKITRLRLEKLIAS